MPKPRSEKLLFGSKLEPIVKEQELEPDNLSSYPKLYTGKPGIPKVTDLSEAETGEDTNRMKIVATSKIAEQARLRCKLNPIAIPLLLFLFAHRSLRASLTAKGLFATTKLW